MTRRDEAWQSSTTHTAYHHPTSIFFSSFSRRGHVQDSIGSLDHVQVLLGSLAKSMGTRPPSPSTGSHADSKMPVISHPYQLI